MVKTNSLHLYNDTYTVPTSDNYLNPSLFSDSNISSIPIDDTDVTIPVSADTLHLLDISLCSTLSDCFDHILEAHSSIDMSSLINSTSLMINSTSLMPSFCKFLTGTLV